MVNGKNEKVADFFRTLSRMAVPLATHVDWDRQEAGIRGNSAYQ